MIAVAATLSAVYLLSSRGGAGAAVGGSRRYPGGLSPTEAPADTADAYATRAHARSYRLAVVADPDEASIVTGGRAEWRSVLWFLDLVWDDLSRKYTIAKAGEAPLSSRLSSGGRGMELSDLESFQGGLYTCDDRTGIVYELIPGGGGGGGAGIAGRGRGGRRLSNSADAPDGEAGRRLAQQRTGGLPSKVTAAPRWVLGLGDGSSDKTFKCEWMARKGDDMYVGAYGKEFVDGDDPTVVVSEGIMWVKRIGPELAVESVDWRDNYNMLRARTGTLHPGYLLHEAAGWSERCGEWLFLPRRVSSQPYYPDIDETLGSNLMIAVDGNWNPQSVRVDHLGMLMATRGFSALVLLPRPGDDGGDGATQNRYSPQCMGSEEIVALKTVEFRGKIETYVSVFRGDGTVLMDEQLLADGIKFEGVAVVSGLDGWGDAPAV